MHDGKSFSSTAIRLSVALLVVLTAASLSAQYTTASLGGTVMDSTGGVTPGAQVTVRNVETSFTQNSTSDATGAFLFSRLPVGKYELTVKKEGFTTYVQEGLILTVNQSASQNVTLQVGQVTERVNV